MDLAADETSGSIIAAEIPRSQLLSPLHPLRDDTTSHRIVHPPISATVATFNLLDSIHTSSAHLLGEAAANNLSALLAHASNPLTWQEPLSTHLADLTSFISSHSTLEISSVLLALATFLVLVMSWTSRLGNLGRFSPFTRSPYSSGDGKAKISDSDFSYITDEDLRRHQAETGSVSVASVTDEPRTSSPVGVDPSRDVDVLILKNKRNAYPVHVRPANTAEMLIGQLREIAADKLDVRRADRIKLLHKGKNLKDDRRTCGQEGVKHGSEILCTVADVPSTSTSGSDDDDEEGEGVDDGADRADGEQGGDTQRRKRNRGKRTKRRNKREVGPSSGTATPDLAPPSQQPSRPPSPATPLDKLAALQEKLDSFLPQVDFLVESPPMDMTKRDFEHKKLSETILAQVLLKLDAVETEGDINARTRRKELVKQTQGVLNRLDALVKQ